MDFPAVMDEPMAAAELTGVGDFGEELAPAVFEPEEQPAVRADSVLSEIAPTLRAEIHDTLEKVAWESFGDVTEKIVADAIDRVEKIAWEVIPQLAETLIKEEIRRLKGESDD
jgi:hypothetical protein